MPSAIRQGEIVSEPWSCITDWVQVQWPVGERRDLFQEAEDQEVFVIAFYSPEQSIREAQSHWKTNALGMSNLLGPH